MKKICIVAECMYCGGVEKSLLSLLSHIDRSKYKITLLLLQKKGDLLSQLPNDIDILEIELPTSEKNDLLYGRNAAFKTALYEGHLLHAFSKLIRALYMCLFVKNGAARRVWYYKSIAKKIKDFPERFDVAIDYMGYGLFNTFYVAEKIKANLKLSWVHFEPEQALPDFYEFEDLLSSYQYIMCVSENSKQQTIKMMPSLRDRCRVFYNIVDIDSLYKQAELQRIKKSENEIAILSIGRLDTSKGFDLGIEVAKNLCAAGYPIKYYIIGDGWCRPQLELQIAQSEVTQNCVVLLGQQLNPYPYLKSCDIYFQPSRHEGYGIAVAEARAFCKPIVVTDFAGAKEQLKAGKTGLIVPCNIEAMTNAIRTLLDNRVLMDTLKSNLENERCKMTAHLSVLYDIFDNA